MKAKSIKVLFRLAFQSRSDYLRLRHKLPIEMTYASYDSGLSAMRAVFPVRAELRMIVLRVR